MKNSTQPPPNPTLSIDIKLRKILRLKCSFVLIFRHPFKCRLVTTTMLSFNPIPSQLSFINLQLVYICITTTEKILEYAMKKSNYITYVLSYSLYSSFMASWLLVVKVIFLVAKGVNRGENEFFFFSSWRTILVSLCHIIY